MIVRSLMMLWIVLSFVAAAAAQAQDASKLLSDQRWQEQSFGVSLLPPVDCKLISQTGDQYLLRMVNSEVPYQITVAVKRSRSAQKLTDIADSAKVQMLDINDAVHLLSETQLKIGDLPAMRQYFQSEQIENKTKKLALIGITIIEVNPFTFCVVQVEGPAARTDKLKSIYEATAATVQIADQETIAKRRAEAIARSAQWRSQVTGQQIAAVLKREQYCRITENDKDIGWLHVSTAPGEFNNIKGYRIAVETTLRLTVGRIDSKAEYFAPFEGSIGEAWSVLATLRPAVPTQPVRTTREIGAGVTDDIEIRIDGSAGVPTKNPNFPRPPSGYLPQAEVWLLPMILPHQAAAEFGFYCYNSNTEQLTYRTERVTPALRGFQIATRIAPNAPELKATYKADGTLIEKDLGGGRKLIGSSLRELTALWKL